MKNKKIIMNDGWAFGELKIITKLSLLAKEGWIFKKISHFGLTLTFERGKSEDVDFAIVDLVNVDEKDEFIEMCQVAGWEVVLDYMKSFLFLKAKAGTTPIYTKQNDVKEVRESQITQQLQLFFISLSMLIVSFFIEYLFDLPSIVDFILIAIVAISAGLLTVSIMVLLAYFFRKKEPIFTQEDKTLQRARNIEIKLYVKMSLFLIIVGFISFLLSHLFEDIKLLKMIFYLGAVLPFGITAVSCIIIMIALVKNKRNKMHSK